MSEAKNCYENGKIYTIRSFQTDKYYIGATCNPLSKRLGQHKQDYKKYSNGERCFISSFEIIKYDDCYIELLEEYKCDNRQQLTKREGELIRQYINNVVNLRVAGRTKLEYDRETTEQKKIYYLQNKVKIQASKSQKINCDCGSIYTLGNKPAHLNTNKHITFINNLQTN